MNKETFSAVGRLSIAELALELAQTKHMFGQCKKWEVTEAYEEREAAKKAVEATNTKV